MSYKLRVIVADRGASEPLLELMKALAWADGMNDRSSPFEMESAESGELTIEIKEMPVPDLLAALERQRAELAVCPATLLPYPLVPELDVVALVAQESLGNPSSLIGHSVVEPGAFSGQPLQGKWAVVARRNRDDLKKLFSPLDERRFYGKVWLVGFGPGDPELMTIKADRILHEADVVYYDDLIDHSVLKTYPGRKVYVGKRKGSHAQAQKTINELLYHSVLSGQTVVRLKGGDPFVFGRGGEESEYLLRRMVPVEIIPGISAAQAAAAQWNIPLTKRGVSCSVTFRTAHCSSLSGSSGQQQETLVYYMGASRLGEISRELLASGLDPQTPAALVRNASLPGEQFIRTTVEEMAGLEMKSPLVVIVGEVVRDGGIRLPAEMNSAMFDSIFSLPHILTQAK